MESITVMVQKEVADRMQSGPGKKDYGALSLAVQYYASPYIVATSAELLHAKAQSRFCGDPAYRYKQPPVAVKNEKLLSRSSGRRSTREEKHWSTVLPIPGRSLLQKSRSRKGS